MPSRLRARAMHGSLLQWTALLLFLVLLAACGKKGPVQPLKAKLPEAPQDFTLRQMGTRFLLSWDLPKFNQNGTPLTDLAGFKVYRMRFDPAEDCPECRDTSVLIRDIDLDFLQDVTRRGDRLYLWDEELKPGFGYKYRVLAFNQRNRDGAPALTQRSMLPPPPPPTDLSATAHDRLVRLDWQALGPDLPETAWLGYNLYRRRGQEPFPSRPLNHDPLTNPFYQDFDVENDTTYFYAVRTVARMGDILVESALSQPTETTPREGI